MNHQQEIIEWLMVQQKEGTIMKCTNIFALALVVALCSVAWGETKSDYDHRYNLAKLKTFDFKSRPAVANDMTGRNSIWSERVRNYMQEQLSADGFQQKDHGSADFLIAYHLGTKQRVDTYFDTLGFPGWHRRGWWGGWGYTRVLNVPYTQSTLVMDVTDAKTGQLVWRGYDTRKIDFNKADRTIEKAVEHLTDRFSHDLQKSAKEG